MTIGTELVWLIRMYACMVCIFFFFCMITRMVCMFTRMVCMITRMYACMVCMIILPLHQGPVEI